MMNLDLSLTIHENLFKINIIDLNVKANSVKLLEENTEENLFDFRASKDFLDKTHETQTIREKNL